MKKKLAKHYSERTVENLPIGSTAWVSWNGSHAQPMKVIGRDATHYQVEDSKGKYSVFLDEVRSTPELAKENCVTW